MQLTVDTDNGKTIIKPDTAYIEPLRNLSAEVLAVLLETPDKFVTNETLIKRVWDEEVTKYSYLKLRVHLVRMRSFLEQVNPEYQIFPVSGRGYILLTEKY